MLLQPSASFEGLQRDFRWEIPADFNIGRAVCDDWALREPERICLEHFCMDGGHLSLTYGALAAQSSAFAQALVSLGVEPGDRVALLLPQCFETVIAHLAIYKMGAIALPLALLFGEEALEYRLSNAGAKVVVTNTFGLSRLAPITARLGGLRHVVSIDPADAPVHSFSALVEQNRDSFDIVASGPDDPALMIYTSGTTGAPKGALHGHRVLAGHMPGFQLAHDFPPQPDDKMWTPSDWAWA
ncbi:AMP-binding protein, partial [Rhizobium sp. 18065]|uniref:AMP-binding protein n=1 Tax=Rhizobium sp. 18065 TaxID=2681411 RepID=UPI001357D578